MPHKSCYSVLLFFLVVGVFVLSKIGYDYMRISRDFAGNKEGTDERRLASKSFEEEIKQLEERKLKLEQETEILRKENEVLSEVQKGMRKEKEELDGQLEWLNHERKNLKDFQGEKSLPDSKDAEKKDNMNLWMSLDPAEVHPKWPGLMFDGDHVLREFVDPEDTRAVQMDKKPKSFDDMSEADVEERFYQLITVNQVRCLDQQRMGNFRDGGWDFCVSGPYKPGKDCLVYSFGIAGDFSFDDAMGNKYGCEVHSYDPSVSYAQNRSEYVTFHKIGLLGVDKTNKRGWTLWTMSSILENNGHTMRTIDYLKMDIEFKEWITLGEMIDSNIFLNVKQFAMELHTAESRHRPTEKLEFMQFYKILLTLEKIGFRRYHHHLNSKGNYTSERTGKQRSCCYEIYYININFLQ